MLTWDDSYAIALALRTNHPHVHLEEVSLAMIYHWVIGLTEFEDDRNLANDQVLAAIFREWFEEANPL